MRYNKKLLLSFIVFSLPFITSCQVTKNQTTLQTTSETATHEISIKKIEGKWKSLELDYEVEVTIKILNNTSIELTHFFANKKTLKHCS